jgi:hypothetical protein
VSVLFCSLVADAYRLSHQLQTVTFPFLAVLAAQPNNTSNASLLWKHTGQFASPSFLKILRLNSPLFFFSSLFTLTTGLISSSSLIEQLVMLMETHRSHMTQQRVKNVQHQSVFFLLSSLFFSLLILFLFVFQTNPSNPPTARQRIQRSAGSR